MTFGDSGMTSEFDNVFRHYFDLDGRNYSGDDTSSENGSKNGEFLLINYELVPKNMPAAATTSQADCGIV